MDDKIIDIFSRETIPGKPSVPKYKKPYKPYEIGEGFQNNLWFYLGGEMGVMRPYNYLTDIDFYSDRLELFYRNIDGVIIVWGNFLEELREPLQDRTLRSVTCFNDPEHIKPSNDLMITDIKGFSMAGYTAAMARVREVNEKRQP